MTADAGPGRRRLYLNIHRAETSKVTHRMAHEEALLLSAVGLLWSRRSMLSIHAGHSSKHRYPVCFL